jgi:hypothetical protein
MIVSGSAGSGKSALISRAVTLSDPSFLDNPDYEDVIRAVPAEGRPPVLSIDAAVLARNKTVDEIAAQLLSALGQHSRDLHRDGLSAAGPLAQLKALLGDTTTTHTIVIDGVDEARSPIELATNLIAPLARLGRDDVRRVRLILGIRSVTTANDAALMQHAHTAELVEYVAKLVRPAPVRRMRTDGEEVTADIAEYVDSLLAASGSYVDRPTARGLFAEAVATHVRPSFLDAGLAGQRLRGRPPVQGPTDAAWLATLDEGISGQLREDLQDVAVAAHPVPHLAAVLRAAAFGAGSGIPWADIWPAFITAILDEGPVDPNATIEYVLGSRLAGYLTRDTEDDRAVYRLAHELLTQVLRQAPESLLTGSR